MPLRRHAIDTAVRVRVVRGERQSRRQVVTAVDFVVREANVAVRQRIRDARLLRADRRDERCVVQHRLREHEADRRRAERVADATAEDALTTCRERCVAGDCAVGVQRHACYARLRVVQLQVSCRNVQRTVVVRCADAVFAVVAEAACRVREAVLRAQLEAGVVRACVLHRVVDAEGVVEVVVIERVCELHTAVLRARQSQRRAEVDHRVILTTEGHGT